MNLEIANRLLALRREHGYSQEELAYKLAVRTRDIGTVRSQFTEG